MHDRGYCDYDGDADYDDAACDDGMCVRVVFVASTMIVSVASVASAGEYCECWP